MQSYEEREFETQLQSEIQLEASRSESYRIEELDTAQELERLKAQVDLVAPIEDALLEEVGLKSSDQMLDLGCGPGYFSERIVEAFIDESLGGEVIGVDIDPALLSLAESRVDARRAEGASLPLRFLVGAGQSIPLPDQSVDLVYARFLFQHLSEPMQVLKEIFRVLRPGGKLALIDTDDGALLTYPTPRSFSRLLEASAVAQRDRGGDRQIGRKLKSLLAQSGFEDTRIQLHPFTSEEVGAEAFLTVTLKFKLGALRDPYLSDEEKMMIWRELEMLSQHEGFFGQALGYSAYGRRPL
ncbi:MAG: methyltransferase domain-containing protein [Myxococcota bacterium]|nr:methyltransferase domain-containing protein [Myxococcota bacterium]